MARRTLTSGGSSVAVWWSCTRRAKDHLPETQEQIIGWPEGYPLPLFPPASFFDIEKVAEKARRQQAQKAVRVSKLRQALRGRRGVLETVKEARGDALDEADSYGGDFAGGDFTPQANVYAPAHRRDEDQDRCEGRGIGEGKDRGVIQTLTSAVINSERSQVANADETVRKRRWGRYPAQVPDSPLVGM